MSTNTILTWDETEATQVDWEVSENQERIQDKINSLVHPGIISKKHNQVWRDKLASEIKKYRWWKWGYDNEALVANEEIESISDQELRLEIQARKHKKSRYGKIASFLDQHNVRTNHTQGNIDWQRQWLEERKSAYQEEKSRSIRWTKQYSRLSKTDLQEFQDESLLVPLSADEKKALLKPEVLRELSLDEYIVLWRRLNPYFLWHITRQWFRDHAGWSNHTWWLEEFHEWFTSTLEDDKLLRPPISVHHSLNPHDRESIVSFVDTEVLHYSSNLQEARDRLQRVLWSSWAAAPKYAADTSVHMAKELVANSTYGGETDNEIFYIFPSDVIASQFDYASNASPDLREKMHEEKWNDIFVWPNDRETNAIPLDMWIVFLPEDTQIDRETGSKYMYENHSGEKKMIIDTDSVSCIRKLLISLKKQNSWEDLTHNFIAGMETLGFNVWRDLNQSAFDALSSYVLYLDSWNHEKEGELVSTLAKNIGLLWKVSENTVESRRYWENYFLADPGKKPSHVVYYSWDPTQAVHDFLIQNGIKKYEDVSDASNDSLLGLPERYVDSMVKDSRAQPGYDFLIQIAHAHIDQHYWW